MIIISASNAMFTSFQRGFNVSLIIRVLRDTSLIVLDWPSRFSDDSCEERE